MGKKILIIGGVALGPKTASRARRLDPSAKITIIERGDLFSYAGCGMPFYIEGSIDDIQNLLCNPRGVRRDEKFFKSVKNIDIQGRTEALKINRDEKTVTVKKVGEEAQYKIPYDKLVLGVGAHAFMPPVSGLDLEEVYRLYDPHDAQAIRRSLDEGVRKVIIVGGGLIGLEICGAFKARGCEVVIIEMMEQLVPGLMDGDMAVLLEKYLREQDINVKLGNSVTQIIDNGSGKVRGVKTRAGKMYPAEMVIVAVGVRPNTKLAEEAGLKLGVTGAIAVNEHLQTSDPDIYAGGDCVENLNIVTKEKCYMPLGSTANKHGRVIGDNITGRRTKFPGVTGTAVFKVLEYNVGKTGLNESEARQRGFDPEIAIAPKQDCANYYPVSNPFVLKMVADKKTGKVLGAQALGKGEAIKRIDVVATALKFGATVKEIADLDLGYAPPYSTAIDPLAHAANIIRNKIEELGHGVKPFELKKKMDSEEEFILLDVRSPQEVEQTSLPDQRVVNIPLNQIRNRLQELPQDSEIIIFCRTSVRAYEAECILRGEGYSDVKFLDGSLDAWPYPL